MTSSSITHRRKEVYQEVKIVPKMPKMHFKSAMELAITNSVLGPSAPAGIAAHHPLNILKQKYK